MRAKSIAKIRRTWCAAPGIALLSLRAPDTPWHMRGDLKTLPASVWIRRVSLLLTLSHFALGFSTWICTTSPGTHRTISFCPLRWLCCRCSKVPAIPPLLSIALPGKIGSRFRPPKFCPLFGRGPRPFRTCIRNQSLVISATKVGRHHLWLQKHHPLALPPQRKRSVAKPDM